METTNVTATTTQENTTVVDPVAPLQTDVKNSEGNEGAVNAAPAGVAPDPSIEAKAQAAQKRADLARKAKAQKFRDEAKRNATVAAEYAELKRLIKTNPSEALKKLETSYEDLTWQNLEPLGVKKPTAEATEADRLARLEAAEVQRMKDQAEANKQVEQRNNDEAKQTLTDHITKWLADDTRKDSYSLVNELGRQGLVYDKALAFVKELGIHPSDEEANDILKLAADACEEVLAEEAEKLYKAREAKLAKLAAQTGETVDGDLTDKKVVAEEKVNRVAPLARKLNIKSPTLGQTALHAAPASTSLAPAVDIKAIRQANWKKHGVPDVINPRLG